ncbi:MAG TPA: hypothetical protein VMV69_17245 [Pirellulales bacterium]|nr:hypothetical protein [Pirellulales bacterium]
MLRLRACCRIVACFLAGNSAWADETVKEAVKPGNAAASSLIERLTS